MDALTRLTLNRVQGLRDRAEARPPGELRTVVQAVLGRAQSYALEGDVGRANEDCNFADELLRGAEHG